MTPFRGLGDKRSLTILEGLNLGPIFRPAAAVAVAAAAAGIYRQNVNYHLFHCLEPITYVVFLLVLP